MVEYTQRIDEIFGALSDPVRRDILERTSERELTVNQIALEYDISLAATSKHLKILHDLGLVQKRKDGRFHYVSAVPEGMRDVVDYLQRYEQLWPQHDERPES